MRPKIIVIVGYLASGKSTFARRLSKEIKVPYLIKDTFKIAICSSLPDITREASSQFSAVTFDAMMYVAERHMEAGSPIIIEGNFVPSGIKKVDEAGVIKALIEKYKCESLTFKFTADTQILHERFVVREKLPERGYVNAMNGDVAYPDFDKWCKNLDGFDVGGDVIPVVTTNFDAVPFDDHIETARLFVNIAIR